MNVYSLPDIIAVLFNFSFIIKALYSSRWRGIKLWLIFIISLFTLWSFSNLALLNMSNESQALFFAQINIRILFLLPASILALSVSHLPYKKSVRDILISLVFFVPILLMAATFPSFNLKLIQFSEYHQYYFKITGRLTPTFYGLIVLSVLYIVLAILLIYKVYKKSITRKYRLFLLLLIYGLVFLFFLFLTVNIPIINSYYAFYFFKALFIIAEIIFFNLAINFLSFEKEWKSLNRAVNYFISTIFVAIYFVFIKLAMDFIDNLLSIHSFWFDVGIVFSLVLFFQPVEVSIHKIIEKALREKLFVFRNNFISLTNELVGILPDDQVLVRVSEFIKDNFHAEQVFFFKLNEKSGTFEGVEVGIEIDSNSELISFLATKGEVVHIFEINSAMVDEELGSFLEDRNIQLILPMKRRDEIFYLIMLGQKNDGTYYSYDDIENLMLFANEINVFLHRNYLYNKVQEEKEERARLEKLAALGQLTAGIAHEIRNPLSTISTAVETLKMADSDDQIREKMIKYVEEEVQRMSNLINDFLMFSKIGRANIELFDAQNIAEKLEVFLESICGEIAHEVKVSVQSEIYVDNKLIYQILTNLTKNAAEAIKQQCNETQMPCEQGWIRINIAEKDDYLVLIVANNGPRIPREEYNKIFEPFYTTKENGTGLGLSLVANMVKAMQGEMILRSSQKQTRFIIKIPKNYGKQT